MRMYVYIHIHIYIYESYRVHPKVYPFLHGKSEIFHNRPSARDAASRGFRACEGFHALASRWPGDIMVDVMGMLGIPW